MFLFEGKFGNVLHTGDCRLTAESLQCFPEKYLSKKGKTPRCQLDFVFLDCTFARFHQKLPSKHSATQQVINCIWKHPAAATVYLTCDLLGQEHVLSNVYHTFGSKIYVDKDANPECFRALMLTVPEILTQDPSSRFHVFDGFPKLYERAAAKLAEAQANFQPEPLIIRPSAQWYACEEEDSGLESRGKLRLTEAVRDQFGVWHVCYSMHSSREELESALHLLAPKWVVSTTPPCRATELDYMRNRSFGTQLALDDTIWKLLDISVEASTNVDISVEEPTQISVKSQSSPVQASSSQLLSLSPPTKRPAVTLFGRARLCIQNSSFQSKDKLAILTDQVIPSKVSEEARYAEVSSENKFEETSEIHVTGELFNEPAKKEIRHSEVSSADKLEEKSELHVTAEHFDEPVKKEPHKVVASSTIGSSRYFSESLKKLYRSMNVPVPRPLPSLVKLKDASKRNKRRIEL